MKKNVILFLCAIMLTGLLTGCNKEEQEVQGTESGSVESQYEYVFRDLSEAVYVKAAEKFAGGDGTKENPYQISNSAELALMENLINDKDGNKEYRKAYYILTNDISLNDTSNVDKWATDAPEYSWNPIGKGIREFEGVFDGNNHVISGVYINTNYENDSLEVEFGLFANVNGTVKNLTIDNSYICVSGYSAYVGGIAGSVGFEGEIDNCNSAVVIECYDGNYGGIAGSIMGTSAGIGDDQSKFSVISNCKFEGTINQIKGGTFNRLGGIVGNGNGNITNCVNKGNVNYNGENVDSVGGIIGYINEGTISKCENAGILNCALTDENGYVSVGGIIGKISITNIGGDDMSRSVTILDCHNTGMVSSQDYAGGIVGRASNDKNEWCITIKDCTNSGKVEGLDCTGGIVSELDSKGSNANGDNFQIINCENRAMLNTGFVGGIIGRFLCESGNVVISDCKNTGGLSATEAHCAGIVAYWQINSTDFDFRTKIMNCENTGSITSAQNAGGIISFAYNLTKDRGTEDTEILIENCVNSGEIITNSVNSYIGGICGNLGMGNIPTTISGCINKGTLSYLSSAPDKETVETDEEEKFTLSRMAGGIVGRVGYGIFLSVDGDKGNAGNIQKDDAIFKFVDCYNSGTLNPTDNEDFYKDYFGGIVGNCSGEDAYSIFVEDCGYANFERGLGNEGYSKIGQKMTEKEIESRIAQ